MNQSTNTELLAALSAERAALLNFTALLEREQAMLVENSTDQLLELSEQKSSDAIGLNELAGRCRSLLQKSIPHLDISTTKDTQRCTQPPADTIRAWLKTHNPECLPVWQEILTLVDRCKQLNNTNGELIQIKLRHNQQTLTVLSNAVNKANLYGPDGQTSFSPGSGRSLGSG